MNLIEYNGEKYPAYVQSGNAQRFIYPFAREFCKGRGLDIGGRKGWSFIGARIINTETPDEYEAMNLPGSNWDFIFSSHTLEHLDSPLNALVYWRTKLRIGGVLFLYLPHSSMEMWRPSQMKRHKHSFEPRSVAKLMDKVGYGNIIASGRDLNWSFAVVGEKPNGIG